MRQNLIATLLVFGLVSLTLAMKKQEAKEALESFGSNCDPKPSDNDYDDILMNNENPAQSAKCFRNCLMKQGSMFDSNDKLDIEQIKAYTEMMFEGKGETGGKMGEKCNAEVNEEDPCRRAHLYVMCLLKEMKENGIKLEELE